MERVRRNRREIESVILYASFKMPFFQEQVAAAD